MWIKNPETRRWFYRVAVAAVPLLTVAGVITAEHGGLWLALVGAVLGTGSPLLAQANVPPSE